MQIQIRIKSQLNNFAFQCRHLIGFLFAAIWVKLELNLVRFIKNYGKTAPSYCAIWDEFSEQHQHQSIKKSPIKCSISTFLMLRKCRFNAHSRWDMRWRIDLKHLRKTIRQRNVLIINHHLIKTDSYISNFIQFYLLPLRHATNYLSTLLL